jgi:predicted metal-dependent phosphoesterase TrpH
MIDLHIHSTASDGSLSPREVARAGKAAGLTIMALTDHDAAGGVEDFLDETRKLGILGVPGIELSAEVPAGQLHLVGLGFDYRNPELQAKFARMLNGREARNALMLEAFNANGIDLTFDEVKAFAGEDLVSRVHFAQALIQRGLVADLAEAFERYLGKGALCYRDRLRYTPKECIEMITKAGGMVIMAHPLSLTTDWAALEAAIVEFKGYGLRGIECFYSTYDTETTVALLRLARRHHLLPSVASDFHGAPKPTIFLGQLHVSPELEAELHDALTSLHFFTART